MHAQIQSKGLQNAGRYAEARDILLSNKGRDLPSTWVLKARAEIALLELQAQMGRPRKALERLGSLAQVHESLTSRALSALAKAHRVVGDLEAAEHVARRIITAHPAPPMYILIDALLLSSEVADARGQETSAVEAATTAVQLAAADRVLLPFIPAGPRLRGLLDRHPALSNVWPLPVEDTPGRWARELPASPGGQQPSEALTEREVSILNWLTTTMTMAEIATELYVSTNTVKTHVAAIYRKLEATNRREAIARGRQLRLI